MWEFLQGVITLSALGVISGCTAAVVLSRTMKKLSDEWLKEFKDERGDFG